MIRSTRDVMLWDKLSNEYTLFDGAVLEINDIA